MRSVEVTACAKLNLGLAVGPAREDGFHDIATVFQSISLADTLSATRTRQGFSLAVRHEEAALRGRQPRTARRAVPAGGENLVLRAARLVHERLGLAGGTRFRLIKRIPAEAGLGGGSADAAAAIIASLALHGVTLALADRLALALELGSDVPFALFGGTALGRGRGERLHRLRLERPLRAIVAMPVWRVSTPQAFSRIDGLKNGLTQWRHEYRFAATLGRGGLRVAEALRLGNTFERVLGSRKDDFESLCARMRAAGLHEPHLTGSGSAVFGLVPEGVRTQELVDRFSGNEPLYAVSSRASGLRLRTQP
ncbi:MAG: 4-(cytidine 5'-diphospho)-2-C-methyl-D-erythritol kinase [Candidatus Eisenbacteria bacterium]